MAKDTDTVKKGMDVSCGEVRIADDVVGNISSIAATEIEGVAGVAGRFNKELMNRMGLKAQGKGVKVLIEEGMVTVDLALVMKYGYNIPLTSKQVQERVKSSIESMTGLTVSGVGIRIVGIDMTGEE